MRRLVFYLPSDWLYNIKFRINYRWKFDLGFEYLRFVTAMG